MSLLVVAAVVWMGIHFGIAGSRFRELLVGRIGESTFRGVFSVVSIGALVFLVRAWSAAPTTQWWYSPGWLRWVLVAVMLVAFVLFVASVSRHNPTMVGLPGAKVQPPRGIQRVTRHPMLWSFVLWAGVHIVGNGDTAAIVFFGTLLVTALAGMPSIDAKLARRDPALWQALSASTSIVPFVAIAQGRNRFVPREIGWLVVLIAVVAWGVVLHFHPFLFGVAPVPL
jgi:uncharacterized membrane protein